MLFTNLYLVLIPTLWPMSTALISNLQTRKLRLREGSDLPKGTQQGRRRAGLRLHCLIRELSAGGGGSDPWLFPHWASVSPSMKRDPNGRVSAGETRGYSIKSMG